MRPAFYDPQKTYQENFTKGPPLLSQKISPPAKRAVTQTTFLGFPIDSPFGIAAGPLLNSTHVKAAFDFGFDVNHYKTQRSVSFPVNEFPNVLFVDTHGKLTMKKAQQPLLGTKKTDASPTKYSITNSFGNPSKGPDYWQEDMRKAMSYAGPGQLLIGSVVGTIQKGFSDTDYFNDFAQAASLAHETGISVIEVNLSCPNVANEGILCFNPDADEAICKKVKQKIGNTPLLVKFGYFTHDQEELLEKILKKIAPYIAGISVINTIPAAVVDRHGKQALPGKNRLMSGICGAGIQWAGIEMTERLSALRTKLKLDYAIIGVGGVMSSKDFSAYRKSGADCVQSCTGAMWNPLLADEVKKSLSRSSDTKRKKITKL